MSDLKNKVVAAIQGNPVSPNRPTTNQILQFDGTEWAPITISSLPPSGAAGGDLNGNYPNPTVAKLQGTVISTAIPTIGEAFLFDGSQWAPTSTSTFAFTAGGDLSGTNTSQKVETISGHNSGSQTTIKFLDHNGNSCIEMSDSGPYTGVYSMYSTSVPQLTLIGAPSVLTTRNSNASVTVSDANGVGITSSVNPIEVTTTNGGSVGITSAGAMSINSGSTIGITSIGDVSVYLGTFSSVSHLYLQTNQSTSPSTPGTPHHWYEIKDSTGTVSWIPIYQ